MAKVNELRVTRPMYARLSRIHDLIKGGEFPNGPAMARVCEVNARTIKRDLDCMRDRLNMPIEYDEKRRGFFYTRPTEFPSLAMSESEVFALLVAHKAIAQYHGTPFQKPLEAAFRRLTGQLGQDSQFTMGNVGEMVSFRPFGPEDADLAMFQRLTQAMQERRAVNFLYRKLGAAKATPRQVHPYHLACIDNHWYLFAFDVARQAMRTYVLARLRELSVTDERFKKPAGFDPADYLRGSFSAYKGTDDFEVVVDFDPWAADLVRGRKWHGSQKVTELPGGGIRLRMRLNSIEEVDRWVLSWGTHATVVRPEALRRRVADMAGELVERYRGEMAFGK